ncbi:MAG: YbaB/EbfC family nucleoid-associated protein [Saprospiraceae bacterium]|jgi:DNA-binding protein YbaB|nr:YbaB/EbfC family nucleoid-associated protein [Saprospiraceae bacterium]MBP6446388.1 YbaB/EbfC family nucleoid-associated protein [Saprospiraceae bacterium]
MLDDLMGNLEKQQAEIQKKLSAIVIEVKQEGLTITGNAAKQVTNVMISKELIGSQDMEMIEDLLVTSINRFIEDAQKAEANETQSMMSEMLPPGFGDLFK